MKNRSVMAVLIGTSLCVTAVAGEPATPTEDSGAPPEAIAKWREMRFGLFVHWGPVSLTGREIGWSRGGERRGHRTGHGTETPVEIYDNLYKEFNPVKFDADEWVAVAKEAGMRYLVFTTKHHDGFCNFDSKLTDYKITSPESPYGKDIAGQLADACHAADFPLGWYYSPPDWHDANYRNGDRHAEYVKYMHGQIEELLTNYGKVDILWFDGLGGTEQDWDAGRLLPVIRRLQPGIIINNRCGLPADHDTPEQRVGGFMRDRPWETCMTICRQWAWKPDDTMKSRKQCIQTLLGVVGGDGNLLFNVGPMPDGRIEERRWSGSRDGPVAGSLRRRRLRDTGRTLQAGQMGCFNVQGESRLPVRDELAERGPTRITGRGEEDHLARLLSGARWISRIGKRDYR